MTSINPHTTRANGTILSATIYNSDHTNHISNAQALNAGKVEGVTPPVVDGDGMVFDGTSGTGIRSLGSPPVVGPAVAVSGNLATFDGTTGTLIQDSGIVAAQVGLGARTNIASAATTNLATVLSHHARITGTTGITSFGTSGLSARPIYLVSFADALTITHNATSLICPDGLDLTTAANDYAWVEDLGGDNWRIWEYVKVGDTLSPGGRAAGADALGRINFGGVLADGVFPGALIAIIEDQKSSGTGAGNITSGADRTRTLNTLVYNRNSAVSLSSNQFTLPAGTWEITWQTGVGSGASSFHQSLLHNVTDAADVARGNAGRADDGSDVDTGQYTSMGATVVTIAAAKAFELRHRVTSSVQGGDAAGLGTEVYSRVIVRAA